MPERDEAIDRMLKEFLERDQAITRKGITLESVANAQETLADGLIEHTKADEQNFKTLREHIDLKFSSHDQRLIHLEARANEAEKDIDRVEDDITTGRHNVPEILDAAAKLASIGQSKTSSKPPKSNLAKAFESEAAKWVVRSIFLLVAAAGGYVLHHLTWNPTGAVPVEHSK